MSSQARPRFSSPRCCGVRSMCKPLHACPNGAIIWTPHNDSKQKGTISFNHAKCTGCGTCADTCRLGIIMLD